MVLLTLVIQKGEFQLWQLWQQHFLPEGDFSLAILLAFCPSRAIVQN